MPILSTDQFGSGTLYTMQTADTFAFLKRDVAYVTSTGPAMVIGTTIGTNATLTIAGMVESGQSAISIAGPTTGFVTRYVNVREGGSVGSRGDAILVFNSDFTLINDGAISSSNRAILVSRGTSASYFTEIINNGTISSGAGTAISVTSGDLSLINTGLVVGGVTATGGNLSLVNLGTIVGSISGSAFGDFIDTQSGDVKGQLLGGAGNDTYIIRGTERVGESFDTGFDRVESHGDYRLPANVEQLILRGEARTGHGNAGDNFLFANDLGNALFGLSGNDSITGGLGDDRLNGGAGDDNIAVSAGQDVIAGGDGIDTVVVNLGGDYVINLASGVVTGTAIDSTRLSSIENVQAGNSGNNRIIGSNAANRLSGGSGDDIILGGAGDDILVADSGNDTFDGGSGIDLLTFAAFSTPVSVDLTLGTSTGAFQGNDIVLNIENVTGTFGNDTVRGSALANRLDGGEGNDALSGLGGNDILVGSFGDDTLTGGGASDTFLFDANTNGGSGTDTITDFQNTFDKISFVGGAIDVTSFAELSFATPGDGSVVISSADGTIILQGFALANVDASDFIFDPVAPLAVPPMPVDRMPQWHDFTVAIA